MCARHALPDRSGGRAAYFGTCDSITTQLRPPEQSAPSPAKMSLRQIVLPGTAQYCAMCAAAMARVCCFMLESMQARVQEGDLINVLP